MDELTREAVLSLLLARQETAYKNLDNNEKYQEICERQEKSEEIVETLYKEAFEKEQRITIHRHYEGEVHKINLEIEEAYIQGLRDCFSLVGFLKGNYNI